MFVWPPMPLQPLDDGDERKLAHSDRLALAMMMAPAARSWRTRNASLGSLPAKAQDPAVVAAPAGLVGSTSVGEGGGADLDDRVQGRVKLSDPLKVEPDELDGGQTVAIHRGLQLGDGRGIDVDACDPCGRRLSADNDGRGARGTIVRCSASRSSSRTT